MARVLVDNTSAEGFARSPDPQLAVVSRHNGVSYDLYWAARTGTSGPYVTFTSLGSPVNGAGDERAPWLSADGLRLYFHRPGTVGGMDLYVATRSNSTQAFGTPALVAGANSAQDDKDPFLTPNEATLYFTSSRGESTDLWFANLSSGSYSPAVHLQVVNSDEPEGRPLVSDDQLRMYFMSKRPGVQNDTDGDLFITERTSTSVNFGIPGNLTVLNTTGIDFPVALSADGCDLYYATNLETGSGSVQDFRLYKARRQLVPNQVTVTINVVGSGSVGTPFNCTASGGTCTVTRTFGQGVMILASSPATWSGPCEPNGARLSSDGIVPFTLDGTCTIDFGDGGANAANTNGTSTSTGGGG